MGRAPIKLKCIEKENARAQTFKGRMKGLKKKMNEFSTKTGSDAFLIVYEGNEKSQPPITWPEKLNKESSIIKNYEALKIEKPPKNFDLEDFFEIRKNMAQDEISKVRKDIIQIKYPTWSPNFTSLDEETLMKFITVLDSKIIACNQQIDMLKNNQGGGSNNFNFGPSMVQSESAFFVSNPNPNLIENTPQVQVIPNPNLMMPLNHYNQGVPYVVDHGLGGSQSQISHIDSNPLQLVATNNEVLVDYSTNQIGMPLDSNRHNNGTIVDPTNNCQFGEFENWAIQPSDVDWTTYFFDESEL